MAARAERRVRKTVSVVFCDLVGSTELGGRLDPEALHVLVSRYGREMRRVLELHGGRVEKFIGDAVMGVFGVPVLHEDDALRAVRAALGMRSAAAELAREFEREYGIDLQVRIGVHTGEVIADPSAVDQALVAGDAVNAAARLEQAAPPGQILIGPATHRLVRDAVRVRRHANLELRGIARPVQTWTVVSGAPTPALDRRALSTPLVGRSAELDALRHAFESCLATGSCRLVTVLGQAGMGKSRLVKEHLAATEARADVLVGRCLPYGEGITYWPLAEMLRERAPDAPVLGLAAELGSDEEADRIVELVAAATGIAPGRATARETQWAVRRLLERLAERRPLVVVVDDVHWAEPAMLELVEYVAASAGGPLLVVCLARPDLLERRPGWRGVGGDRHALVTLGPLADGDGERLVEAAFARRRLPVVRAREILEAAGGNPLFLEQLAALGADHPAQRLPPTIHALLTARIDELPSEERIVLEAASVEGRRFHRRPLDALLADHEDVEIDEALRRLVDRELVRSAPATLAGDRGYRFVHMLVRDAAYGLLAKATRADLHRRFGRWLAERSGERLREIEEIVGYHLEQAYRYGVELRRVQAEHAALASEAAGHLRAAARRTHARSDLGATVNLLGRAAELLDPASAERAGVLVELGTALHELGRFREASRTLDEAARLAGRLGDAGLEARARVERLVATFQVDTDATVRRLQRRKTALARVLGEAGDEHGLARLAHLEALGHWIRCRTSDADEAWQRTAEHAGRAGDRATLEDALTWLTSSAYFGPVPTGEAIERVRGYARQLRGNPVAEAHSLQPLAGLLAMRGDFAGARALIERSDAVLRELPPSLDAAVSHHRAYALVLEGDLAGAERLLRSGCETLERIGEKAIWSTTAGELARVVHLLGRDDEALALTLECEALTAEEDLGAQAVWRGVRARILARRGDAAAAPLAEEAVAIMARTDWTATHADTLVDLAVARRALGEEAGAAEAALAARQLYAAKEHLVGIEVAQHLLAAAAPT